MDSSFLNTKKSQQLMGIILVALILAGCGGDAPAPTNAPTPTPVPPTATPLPPTPTSVPLTATPLAPTATPIPLTATPVTPPVTPVPPTLSIDSFGADVVDNGDGGKTVTFNWQTSGATGVRIFNGATFTRFGTWWTDLPLDGTHRVEIANTAYKQF